MFLRGVLEGHVIQFFRRPIHDDFVETLRAAYRDSPDGLDHAALMLRMTVLWAVTPPGGFPHSPGENLAMLCRLIEAAMCLVDWKSVAHELATSQVQGGK